MKQCISCTKYYSPSSRHKKCPSCREKGYKVKYNKLCSCGKLIQQTSEKCITCNNKDKRIDNYRYITSGGYVYVIDKNHPRTIKSNGRIFEHILVMEKRLGRNLLPNENVHHKNGIKTDNRDENLELWTRIQPNGARVSDLIAYAKNVLKIYGEDETKYS